MPVGKVGVGGYTRRSKTGKVVRVSSYTQERDLVAEMNALGRSQVAATPGQMPGNRTIPLSPGVGPEQLKMQKARVAALRKQVAALRKANPEAAAVVESTKKKMSNTVAAKTEKARKKADAEKKISDAKKVTQTRGADPDKLKEATDTLEKVAQTEKNRKAAAEKAKASKAAKAAEEAKAKEPTKDEKQALEDYMWEGSELYKVLNRTLRKGYLDNPTAKWNEESLAEKRDHLDSYLRKSQTENALSVFRGISEDVISPDGEPPMPGTVLEDNGYVSTSTNRTQAQWFGDMLLEIELPKGSHAIETGSDEEEVLLPRGMKFTVTDVDFDSGVIKVEPTYPDYLQEAADAGQDSKQGESNSSDSQASSPQAPDSEGVSGANEVGAGGREGFPTPALTPEDLKAILGPVTVPDGKADREASTDAFKRMYEGEYAGFSVQMNTTYPPTSRVLSSGLGMMAEFDILKDGERVGTASRTIGTDGYVRHTQMRLNQGVQGQGFSHAFNKAAEEHYRSMGLKGIKLGTEEVGGYAWARAGYDWDIEGAYTDSADIYSNLHQILDRIADEAEQILDGDDLEFYDAVQDQLEELRRRVDEFDGVDAENLPTPFEFSQVGYQPGEIYWPGKTGMIGSEWFGVKKL